MQRKLWKIPEQMMLYSITTICWSYRKYIDFRVGQLWHVHRPQSVVYNVDYFVMETPSSFLILTQYKSSFLFYLSELKL